MKLEFVPYELALRLKALGFDEPCFGYFLSDGMFIDAKITRQTGDATSSPTWQSASRWFREKYELRISNYRCSIKKENGVVIGDGFRIFKYGKDTISTIEKETYEEGELACLTKLIEIVESKTE